MPETEPTIYPPAEPSPTDSGQARPTRRQRVQTAIGQWTRELIDLGGRNNLLRYRELRLGTLEVSGVDVNTLSALLQNRTVRLSALFRGQDALEPALRRARVISAKAKENAEERGIETLNLACGLATWENKRAEWTPASPVLLRQATLRPLGAAQDDFELTLVGDMEVNPTLVHVLKVDFDCSCDEQGLLERVDGSLDEPWELEAAYDWLKVTAAAVPGFGIESRLVLANFAYAKLPMVRDLEVGLDGIVEHDIIAAIAGDEDARDLIRTSAPRPDDILTPDQTPLADEFLILDADSSQNYAINAVLAGESLIVKGPPGTGKSQSIANMIATMVARGKRVLFVAEKRAAVDAVLKRLTQEHLDDLVLNIHGGVASRRMFAQEIGRALAASRTAPVFDYGAEQQRVEQRREVLNGYTRAVHETRSPWGVSVYAARAELIGLSDDRFTKVAFHGPSLEHLDAATVHRVEQDLESFVALGGLGLRRKPWGLAAVTTAEDVPLAFGAAEQLASRVLPEATRAMSNALAESGCAAQLTAADAQQYLELWNSIRNTLLRFKPSIFEQDLPALCLQLEPGRGNHLVRMAAVLFSRDYRIARKQIRSLALESLRDHELIARCVEAREQAQRWRALDCSGAPILPSNIASVEVIQAELMDQLAELRRWLGADDLAIRPRADVQALVASLISDRQTVVNLPELRRLESALIESGLAEFLEAARDQDMSAARCREGFRSAWLRSVLERLELTDPVVGGFSATRHDEVVEDFKAGDRKHLQSTAGRVRRACAERAVAARDEFREQAQLVQHQANLKRRHMPVRAFFEAAPDVLLALKPCWIMSPLGVSQLLPPKTYFDVVIFDEASQVTPADAISSILRGKQVVVAGDQKQLPPTAFFASADPGDPDPDPDPDPSTLTAGTQGFESILDALAAILRFRTLLWHYRSKDERLIAFSNAHIYDRMLTTFAGVGGNTCLAYEPVDWDSTSDANSPTPEVERVIDLVIGHARNRPSESLGVIAMGIKHANRIQEALRQRLHDDPRLNDELAEFFDETTDEPFFAKNLERVQGDERDAIILSVGYGRDQNGNLPYRFGPLLLDGGERRLNVAITRAKRRLTLVSSFSAKDMDPGRSNAEGVKLLRQYLQYVESGGNNLGDVILERPVLNPFEIDVRDALASRGLRLTPQYGSSGYMIDFAVQHPDRPGTYVLAIECDGASYHSQQSARDRDRLRQEQLERLGWRFHRIWSSDWFHSQEEAIDRAVGAYQLAVRLADDISPPPKETSAVAEEMVPPTNNSPVRSGVKPTFRSGLAIEDYSRSQLIGLVRWIRSDSVLRTEEELVTAVMKELGFQRHGTKIVSAIVDAITHA